MHRFVLWSTALGGFVELTALRWDQVELDSGSLHVTGVVRKAA